MSIKIGLIGAGRIAQTHLDAYSENTNVEAIYIADTSDVACRNTQNKYPKVKKSFRNYKELIQDKSSRLVDICVPHYLHYPITMDSLKSGKDVLCEKPIAITLKEANDMIDAAKRLERRLFIDMNMRFMPYHKVAKKLIDSGEIGKPFLAVFNIMGNEFANMNNPNDWKGDWKKAGGGAMIDTGFHALYMMLHFFGKVIAVTAVAERLLVKPENKADDNTVAILEFEKGVLGTIAISYTITSEEWNEKRHIYGTEGSIHIEDKCTDNLILINEGKPKIIDIAHPNDIHPHAYSIKCALDHYIDCIIQNKEPETTAEEARDALAVALAIYESSRKGRKVLLK